MSIIFLTARPVERSATVTHHESPVSQASIEGPLVSLWGLCLMAVACSVALYAPVASAQTVTSTSSTTAPLPSDVPLLGDIDGDGRSDLIVWRAGTSAEFRWVLSSGAYSDVAAGSKSWGTLLKGVADVPLIADIDGDRKGDLIVWRPSTATFHWLTSSGGYSTSSAGSRQWGAVGQSDVPMVSDIDGDGRADLIIWRRGTGTFYWLTSSSGYSYTAQGSRQWGGVANGVTDVPLLKDADGDGRADLFYWRPKTATFHWLTSSTSYNRNAARSRQWGAGDQPDVPLLGDIDGDGKADLIVWRQGTGTFYWLTSSSGYSYTTQGAKKWGGMVNGIPDVPLTSDIDGDGRDDLIVASRATSEFRSVISSTGYSTASAGAYYPRHSNYAPVVVVGPNQAITLPAAATLDGKVSDDGFPSGATFTHTWSKISGPGTVTFGNVNAPSTTAVFSAPGAYALRLLAHDGALSSFADVTVTVSAASSCTGVTVAPSTTDLQAVVNAHPEGTTFCFQSGIYRLSGSVLAKSRDRFIGQPGTVLDGQNRVTKGIWGYGGSTGQRDILVQGLTLINFQETAVAAGWYWTIRQNDIQANQTGVVVNSYATLDGNYIHDNRQYGLAGGPVTDVLIVNNEIARNNTDNSCRGACVGDAGASKIVGSTAGTTGVVWRNNNVHDNIGHGIWSDGNVRGALYEGNTVVNNSGSGIFHEISWDAIIRNNIVANNDAENIGRSCWWGANILINTSANVEVYGNTVTASNGSNGICAVSGERGEVAPYPTVVANFYAHDNIVSMTGSGTSGLVQGSISGGTNNRFVQNIYRVASPARAWWTTPAAPAATWDAWKASGQDIAGTLSTW